MLDGLLVVVVHAKGGVAAANFLAVAHREPSLGNTWGDMLAKATDGRRKGNRRENNSWPAAKAHCCQHCNRCWSQRAVADQPAHGTRWQNSCRARCGHCQEEVLARRPLQPCRSVGELQEGSPQLLLQLPLPLFACTFRQRHRIKHQSPGLAICWPGVAGQRRWPDAWLPFVAARTPAPSRWSSATLRTTSPGCC